MALVNLDRLAEDLQIFATAEFDLIELADGHSRASVIMPQKKNPYALNYIRGAVNQLTGTLVSSATVGRTPSGQIDNRIFAYGDVPRALEMATGVATLMAAVLAGLNGFATATDLAETITLETGLDFRTAHRIVGRLVRDATTSGRSMSDLCSADLDAAAQTILNRPVQLAEAAFLQAIDPATAVAARRSAGGVAPEPLAAMLTECRATLTTDASWCEQTTSSIVTAEEMLVSRANALCGEMPCPST
jgi:argininosuccinate lyase